MVVAMPGSAITNLPDQAIAMVVAMLDMATVTLRLYPMLIVKRITSQQPVKKTSHAREDAKKNEQQGIVVMQHHGLRCKRCE
jgi:hypothetical protein